MQPRIGLSSELVELIFRTFCSLLHIDGQYCRAPPDFASRPNPIKKGYTAFGDSYAAGIGTGNSSSWGCRQGRYSYPDLIGSTVQGIDFQNLACSGATAQNLLSGGPNSQTDAW